MKRGLLIGSGIVLGLLMLVAGAALWVARSAWLREKVRLAIIEETGKATGGKVELGAFRFDWSTLTAEVDRFVIHGTEPTGQAPLLSADRITIHLKIISLLKKDIDLSAIEAATPRAHLIIYADGRTNVPEPKVARKGKSAVETILDLKIGKFDLREGSFLAESPGQPPRAAPWAARGEGLAAHVDYEATRTRYSGTISLAPLHLESPELPKRSIDVDVAASAALERNRLLVSSAQLKTAQSEIQIRNGVLDNFASPVITAQYQAKLALPEFVRSIRGVVDSQGDARYVSRNDYRVAGKLESRDLSYDVVRDARLSAEFEAIPEKIDVKQFRAFALGGEASGSGELIAFERFRAKGRLEHFDIDQLAALETKQKLPYDGVISGPFEANGTLRQTSVQAKLAIAPAKSGPPVEGEIAIDYNSIRRRIALGHSWIALPHSRLDLSGTLGERLDVRLDSTDAGDLLPLMGSEKPDIAYASFSFNGTVAGPLANPRVAGHASGQNIRYQQQTVESASADFTGVSNNLTITKGDATYGGTHATAAGSIELANWKTTDNSALNASVSVTNADMTRLMALAGQKNVPVSGTLNATAQITGTMGDPQVNAAVTLAKGVVYGQPYDSLTGRTQILSRDAQSFTGVLVSGSKRVNLSGRFDHAGSQAADGSIEFNVTSNTMPLAEIAAVHEREPDIAGFGKFHADGVVKINHDAKGQAVFDVTNVNADASTNGLELGGRVLGDARLTAQTQNDRVAVHFESNAAKAMIQGDGTVRLQGDYTAEGSAKFSDAGLNALAALFVKPGEASNLNFDGTAQGDLTFRGPLKQPDRLTAGLNIDKIELHPLQGGDVARALPNFSVTNSGPIRISLDSSVLRVEDAHLKAPETDLTISGTAPLTQTPNGTGLDLRAQGTMNLAIARSVSPDLTSSGVLTLDATVHGSYTSPDVIGRASMKSGEFRINQFSNGLSNVNAEIVFSGTRATIQQLSAETGGGTLNASGFAALTGGTLTFRLETQAHGVRVRYPEGVSSVSDADLTLAGTTNRSQVSGEITVRRVAITPSSDTASILAASSQPLKTPSAENGALSNMNLDVQIVTATDLALQTSLTQSVEADANLRLRGTATNPAVLGRINITEGEMVFFGNKYTINQGTISFFNATKIEPIINLDLETKARGVDVILTVSGPMTNLNMSYRSDPPLQFSEILSLLATGRAPSDPTTAISASTTQSQSFTTIGANALIGQAITSPVAGRLQRFFGVSRLKIDPQLTGITATPQARLTVEQQVTPDILFTYITDVSNTSTQLIRVEWAINKRWSAILVREENGYVGVDFAYKKRFK